LHIGWAQQCDNYAFFAKLNTSKQSEQHLRSKFSILEPVGLVVDEYEKLSLKVFATFRDTYSKYGHYDWYLKADDDTFIFMDHLKMFLKDKKSTDPVTYGHDFLYDDIPKGYHSGGAGYVLSNEALRRMHEVLVQNDSFCETTSIDSKMIEDLDVAKCLRRLKIYPGLIKIKFFLLF
jgi:glycoprotein-N-acetylgalactosamine 3-beta-galactosyltransferase